MQTDTLAPHHTTLCARARSLFRPPPLPPLPLPLPRSRLFSRPSFVFSLAHHIVKVLFQDLILFFHCFFLSCTGHSQGAFPGLEIQEDIFFGILKSTLYSDFDIVI